MNKGYNDLSKQKINLFRMPPQVKFSKTQIFAKCHKIPTIRFKDQALVDIDDNWLYFGTQWKPKFWRHKNRIHAADTKIRGRNPARHGKGILFFDGYSTVT